MSNEDHGKERALATKATAGRVLQRLADRPPETRKLFHRDYVAPLFDLTIEDVDVLQRIVEVVVAAMLEPTPEALARLRSAVPVLEGRSMDVGAPRPDPSPRASAASPWAAGAPTAAQVPARVARSLEPVEALAGTADAIPGAARRPVLPFEGAARKAPAPTLTLAHYASYRAAKDASQDQAARFLEQHGVADAAAEEAGWEGVIATDPEAARKYAELKRSYDAWWKKVEHE